MNYMRLKVFRFDGKIRNAWHHSKKLTKLKRKKQLSILMGNDHWDRKSTEHDHGGIHTHKLKLDRTTQIDGCWDWLTQELEYANPSLEQSAKSENLWFQVWANPVISPDQRERKNSNSSWGRPQPLRDPNLNDIICKLMIWLKLSD